MSGTAPSKRRVMWAALACLGLVGGLHWPSTGSYFHTADDWLYLHTAMSFLDQGFEHLTIGLDSIANPKGMQSGARPVGKLMWVLDYLVWGTDAFGFRLTNLLWHVAAVGLVFALVWRLTGSALGAFVAGVFFGLNPVTDQGTVMIAAREDQIACVAILAAVWWWPQWKTTRRGLWLAALLLVVACFAKIIALVMVPLLLAYDLVVDGERPSFAVLLRRYAPQAVAVGLVAVGLYLMTGFEGLGAVDMMRRSAGEAAVGPLERLALGFFLPLQPIVEDDSLLELEVLRGAILLIAVGVALDRRRIDRRLLIFAALWLALTLIIPARNLWADAMSLRDSGRYLLVPSVAFAVLLGAAFPDQVGRAAWVQLGAAAAVVLLTAVPFATSVTPTMTGVGETARRFMAFVDQEYAGDDRESHQLVVALSAPSNEMTTLLVSSFFRAAVPSTHVPLVVFQGGQAAYRGYRGDGSIGYGGLVSDGSKVDLRTLDPDRHVLAYDRLDEASGFRFQRAALDAPPASGTTQAWSRFDDWTYGAVDPAATDDGWTPPRTELTSRGLMVEVPFDLDIAATDLLLREGAQRFPPVLRSPALELEPAQYCELELDIALDGEREGGIPPAGLLMWSTAGNARFPPSGLIVFRYPEQGTTARVALYNAPSWQAASGIARLLIVPWSRPRDLVIRQIRLVACPR